MKRESMFIPFDDIEFWKPIKGYEGLYEVSNLGRVKSIGYGKERIKKLKYDKDGYLTVNLNKNKIAKTYRVHKLVMEAFVGECPDGHEVDHIDYMKDNNKLSNLRYLSAYDNCRRKSEEWKKNVSEGAKKRVKNPEWLRKNAEANKKNAKDPEWRKKVSDANKSKSKEWLSNNAEAVRKALCQEVNQYDLLGNHLKTWRSASEASKELGCSSTIISNCCNGKQHTAWGFIWRKYKVDKIEVNKEVA